MNHLDTLIIGAGMAGLTAARLLTHRSESLALVDKGRGVGGRVATRRWGDARADHGAACFRLQGETQKLWNDIYPGLSLQDAPHELDPGAWTCPAGMSALPKAMAQDLPVELQQSIETVERKDEIWIARSKEGKIWTAHKILITSPLWQTADFFKTTQPQLGLEIQDLARLVEYEPQWTLIIKLPSPSQSLGAVYQKNPHPDIASLYDQGRKGLPHAAGLWVLHASQGFSATHLEADPSWVMDRMMTALRSLGWKLENAEAQAHRWRYARVKKPLGRSFVTFASAPGLYLAGDFCLGSQVELAAQSGWAAADAL
ncbi:MAG TPA: FAD-dependent oxidoreductase [Oligoflexus sp.]|uniref:NAD(P)/FAD-dependent oxidoreductase n=1 Tax=Oligoflexus sp. TaxID=1971216 RepID=UPI002D80CF5A|nr:FAD-dependent oxidoreductase [Oligoflexus sp.]HET9237828.1 FAD-dependent oxidoreductase [Oligoflexus sp.]